VLKATLDHVGRPSFERGLAKFPLIDHFYADSEVSVDGHLITSGAALTVQQARVLRGPTARRGWTSASTPSPRGGGAHAL
jgi:hypothetical protein